MFQKKHWFDDDITIEYLTFLLDVVYPGKKVGLSIDMAPAHKGGKVAEYVKQQTEKGRLVLCFINGGLTSVLQVADLIANKPIKALIKKYYYDWRRSFIIEERSKIARNGGDPHTRIKLKMKVDQMTTIIEQACKQFNDQQKRTRSVAQTFRKAGQDPWYDCREEFQEHLQSLSTMSLYGSAIEYQNGEAITTDVTIDTDESF